MKLCSFRLFLGGKAGKEIPDSSRFDFLEKFLANKKCFALSEAEDNISGPLDKEDIANLPLLRALIAIGQNCRGPSFREVIDSFVLLAWTSLAASITLLQGLLACLSFILDAENLAMTATQAAENH